MDKTEWLSSSDWLALWGHVELTDRKRQLLAVAVCRSFAHLLTDTRSVRMMEFTEAWADLGDDNLTDEQWDQREDLYDAAKDAAATPGMPPVRAQAAWAAAGLGNDSHKVGRAIEAAADVFGYQSAIQQGVLDAAADLEAARAVWQHPVFTTGRDERGGVIISALIREIVGNPFRPVAFSPSWRTDTAVSLARQMYESRDFGAMPILADALQDAGCDSEEVLAHCRDPKQVHVRGCWVVDLVLGKA